MNFIDEIKSMLAQSPALAPEPPADPTRRRDAGERPNPWVQKSPGFQQNCETGEVVEVRTVSKTVRVISDPSEDGFRPALDYDADRFVLETVGSLGVKPLCAAAHDRIKEIERWQDVAEQNKRADADQERHDKEFVAWEEARSLWAENDINFVHSLNISIEDGELYVPDPYEGYPRRIKAGSMDDLRKMFGGRK
jgi:hypothetical protein